MSRNESIDVDDAYRWTPAYHQGYAAHERWIKGQIDLPPNPYPEGSKDFKSFNVGWNDYANRE